MSSFDTLKTSLSDIIQFDGSIGSSKSGALRLEIDEETKTAVLSIALPDPTIPQLHLLSATGIIFISILLPSYPHALTIISVAGQKFGTGHNQPIVEKSKEGTLTMTYDKNSFVYDFHVRLL